MTLSSPSPLSSLEGFYLYTHVSGLALQAFQVQMAQFSAAQAAQAGDAAAEEPSAPALPDEASLGAFLQDGYAALDTLGADVAAKLAQVPADQLAALVGQLPANRPALTRPLSGAQFYEWLVYMLEQPATAAIYQLHHLFSAGPMMEEDPAETIREAIAFDDPSLLDASATIEYEHLQLAIQASSLQVLPHLLACCHLTQEETSSLLALALTFDEALPVLLNTLKPSQALLEGLKSTHPEAAAHSALLHYEASL